MKYMLLIYNRPDFVEDLSDNAREELFAEVDAIMAELTESGELVGGQALTDPSTARTVRQGTTPAHTVTDGPFMESKEQFCGYVEVDVDSRDRAVEIAARWPDVRYGGAMEVRAVMHDGGAEM